MQAIPYASACGSLMYAMVSTRLDIANAIVVSRFMSQLDEAIGLPSSLSLDRYLKGTKEKCICYGYGDLNLHGYRDSNMAGDVDTRKSNYGYIYTLIGRAISWCSLLQRIVALSTTEAEYISTIEE